MHSNQILLFAVALALCLALCSAQQLIGGAPCVTNTDCTFGVLDGSGNTVDGGTCINGLCDCVTQVGVGSIGSFCQCRPSGTDCGSGLDYWFNGVRSCVPTCPEPSTAPAQWSAATIAEFNNSGDTWTAGVNPLFAGLTLGQVATMTTGAFLPPPPSPTSVPSAGKRTPTTTAAVGTLSTSFNAATQWPACASIINNIRNQGLCGAGVAMHSTSVLADRACIATGGDLITTWSPQDMVSCNHNGGNDGCNGAYLDLSWQYLITNGVELDFAFPYTSGSLVVPACGSHATSHPRGYAQNWAWLNGVSQMQSAISTRGPIVAGMYIYTDLYNYVSGIYHHVKGSYVGAYACKIVGWGTTGSNPYWIVHFSWGTNWAMSGVVWIRLGTDECGIEDYAIAGQYATIH